jgi:hypothetical protein
VLAGYHRWDVHSACDSTPFFSSLCLGSFPSPSAFAAMSPSSPPVNSWISDFEDLLVPTATSSSSFSEVAIAPATVASGTSGRPDGESDGGAKRSHLFFFSAALARSGSICLGVVGTGARRFCIKKKIPFVRRVIPPSLCLALTPFI